MTNTLKPIAEPYPEAIAKILSQYPQVDGYILTLFRTFANSKRFLEKGVPNLLDKESPLSLRIREVVILRVTANKNCEYEWGIHVTIFGSAAGLTDAQIAATRSKAKDPALWDTKELYLLEAIDELCSTGSIRGITLTHFQRDWTQEEQLEILALCGAYHTVSFVANTAKLENEAFAATFPN